MRKRHHQETFNQFCKNYSLAWNASQKPTIGKIVDVFDAVLDDKTCDDPSIHALHVFFRNELRKNAPLNWFLGEALTVVHPEKRKHIDVLRQDLKSRVMNLDSSNLFSDT